MSLKIFGYDKKKKPKSDTIELVINNINNDDIKPKVLVALKDDKIVEEKNEKNKEINTTKNKKEKKKKLNVKKEFLDYLNRTGGKIA